MFLFILIPFFLFADGLTKLFAFSNELIHQNSYANLHFSDFNIKKCKVGVDLNISNKINLAKYEYYHNDLGLYLNFGGSINDKTAKKSLTAGLTWKLLKDGYRAHQDKADIIKFQNRLNKLNHKQLNNSFIYYNDYNFIIYFFNKKKINLLTEYLKFLNFKFELFKKRYFYHQITLDQLLEIKQNIENIKNLKKTYQIFNKKVICKNRLNGDIASFNLNYKKIYTAIQDKNITLKINLNNQIINKEYNKFDNWTLDLYVNRELLSNKGDTFGFQLDIPLFKNSTQLKRLEKLKTLSNIQENKIRLYLYLQKNYYVFRYKLSDLIKMKFKQAYVIAQLKRAKLRYEFHIGNDNIERIISNIDSLFAIKLQLLDIKQQLLLQSYSLLYNLNLGFKDKYVKRISLNTNLQLRQGNRSLYIWANGFKRYNNKILIDFLKLKNVKIALISVSKYENFSKLQDFLKLAKQNNIEVQFLIGNNSWIYPKNRYEIDKKLKFLERYHIYKIHLDVEPQAMPDLKHNKKRYLEMYLEMIKYIFKKFPMYKINIAIPPYYPLDIVLKISKYVNKIYLMAYSFKDINQLIRKVNKYEVIKNKLVVVFNLKDYKNEYQLESTIDDFISKSGYKNIALHNLKEYIKVSE